MKSYYISIFLLFLFIEISGQEQLIYDPEKGIVSANESRQKNRSANNKIIVKKELTTDSFDLHSSRQKDPPGIYFRSGLEYYKDGDYVNAMKNFMFADSADPQPHYTLWIGKTWRKLNDSKKSYQILQRIISELPQSDVADDALFEIALYYQDNNFYKKAYDSYTQLIEQYPFGLSFYTGKELREIARYKRNAMRNQIMNFFASLGYTEKTLSDNYSRFQKDHDLEITGEGDSVTVTAVKAAWQKSIEKEKHRKNNDKLIKEHMDWVLISGLACFLNLVALFFLRSKVKSKAQQLTELNKTLTDLDTKKL
ncbi:MAG: hypothetical protein Q4F84_11345 [Fibrobacter sp.]|nr:hypothetical protein [Fibrobacter sp.]